MEIKYTVNDLFDHITKHMTAEEAFKKLLSSSMISYQKLKFSSKEESVHPEIIIANACMDLGWGIGIEKEGIYENVRGMIIDEKDYIENIFTTHKTKVASEYKRGFEDGEKHHQEMLSQSIPSEEEIMRPLHQNSTIDPDYVYGYEAGVKKAIELLTKGGK